MFVDFNSLPMFELQQVAVQNEKMKYKQLFKLVYTLYFINCVIL